MTFSPDFLRRCHWLNLPGTLLFVLLQRTPVVRVMAAAEQVVIASPLGAVLRSAAAAAASLGALHTLAGATEFVINRNPVTGTVGQALQPAVSFTYNGTPSPPASFQVSGTLPPGLQFIPAAGGGVVNSGTPVIAGTPTQAGSYTVNVVGFNSLGGTGLSNGVQVSISFEITGGAPTSSPAFTTQPAAQTVNVGVTVTLTVAASGSPAPTFQWQKNGVNISGATGTTLTLNNVQLSDAGTYRAVATNSAGTANSNAVSVAVSAPANPPAITAQPASQVAAAGGTVTLTVAASEGPALQWLRNGVAVAGATGATLTLNNVQPANTGLYRAVATNSAGTAASGLAIVGVSTAQKVIGDGAEIGTDIPHPNTNIFDQVLLRGAAATVKADTGQVTRTSYIDLNDDIVQIEFAGPGNVSLVLTGSSGPANPVKYTQDLIGAGLFGYMKGHVGIVVTGATVATNLSIFTVGRATAFDPTGAYNILVGPSATNVPANNGSSLFSGQAATSYDGVADVAFVAISSADGKFGGLRSSNARYWATAGLTGVFAPGVEFTGPVFVGDITAMSDATPYLQIGSATGDGRTWITGGNLSQGAAVGGNGRAVQVSGITQLAFKDGSTSHGTPLAAKSNAAVLEQNGVNVTSQIVVNP